MNKQYFEFENNSGELIKGDIYLSSNGSKKPAAIVSHGFKGYREWGFFPYISEELSKENFIAVNHDFSLNGVMDPDKFLFDNDKFRRNTVSTEIADLTQLINKLPDLLPNDEWNSEIYLMGHSLGGAVSILTASLNPTLNIKKLSTWGAIGKIDRNTERQKKLWREKGVMDFKVNITGQELSLNVDYLEDKESNKEKYNLAENIASLDIPVQIIHGDKDFTVRLEEAKILKEAAGENAELKVIEKCNHIFNITHPFKGSSQQLDNALKSMINFFK